MKKIMNQVQDMVRESCEGFAQAHADIVALNAEPLFIYRRDMPVQVALISGGGSGHEPLHAGFVGRGMLAAACPGEVFTSPVPDQMLAATRQVTGAAGALYIVKNYTGDVMNFELAAELAAAEGLTVQSVVIGDDVAVQDSTWTAGRRGVGGTVFLEKLAGAAAEQGASLEGVRGVAERVMAGVRSMGLALTGATVPAAGQPNFTLQDNELELGIGIHGEPGRARVPMLSAADMAAGLLDPVVADLDLKRGEEVLVLTNGMGGTPLLELYLAHREVRRLLDAQGVKVARQLVGNYVTSLEMQGLSVSVLRASADDLKLWDAPVHTAALRWGA
ncbi:dihydroxyacetone kinase subunit DhaK [Deinococcus cavernae]|uniref:Dihydroxyacetone kinase subunit DhaK n=1 Tax=Deinococcus cavernae TaxID=2320857 RepID=A0A418VCM8_9DEIO|nr:dihydroxyacetone kinase subunit DhaK [Deinococcus cavernae]RJF73750.1 dihydroxyacetone kinase subunit DhaK [Deinococcus cavernae]